MTLSQQIRKAALWSAPKRYALLIDWFPSWSWAKRRNAIRDFVTHNFHELSITNQRTLLLFVAEALE